MSKHDRRGDMIVAQKLIAALKAGVITEDEARWIVAHESVILPQAQEKTDV